MRVPGICLFLLGLVLIFQAGAVMALEQHPAQDSALTWLQLIDQGKFEQSWKRADEYFKKAVTKNQWQKTLGAVRTPLGELISRKIDQQTFKKNLPGAPDGEYTILIFKTSFSHKKEAMEQVTLVKRSPRDWKVVGYFIR